MKWRVRLVDNWTNAWRWASIRFMAIAASIQGAWLFIPDDMRQSIPSGYTQALTLVLLGLGMTGRLLQKKEDSDD